MKFTVISDTHGKHEQLFIPDSDLIIHTGDANVGSLSRLEKFLKWYRWLPHKYKILIAGNHDWVFQNKPKEAQALCKLYRVIYLQDSGINIDGINIWGSPQTPEFCNWAFNCWRTQKEKDSNDSLTCGKRYDYIGKYWDMIPKNTDILLTHGPPYDILDKCPNPVGCEVLLEKVREVNPRFHIFGHIHEDGRNHILGNIKETDNNPPNTMFINAASLDGNYNIYPNKTRVYDFYTFKQTWGGSLK